jgi:hypothetical protein
MTTAEARLDLHGLAHVLDRSYDWTVRNWRRLVDEQGLPKPFSGTNGRKPRWSRKLVEAWRDGEAPPSTPVNAAQPAPAVANDPQPARLTGLAALLQAAER